MKKVLFALLLIVLSVNCAFSFDTKDILGNDRTYYSITSPSIIVKTTQNLTSLNISYNLGYEISKEINFSTCDNNNYCAQFSLLGLIDEQNKTPENISIFTIDVNNELKQVYLDSKSPEINFSNYTIQNANNKVILNFNFSDNSDKFSSVNLYEEINGAQTLLKNVQSVKTYEYSISVPGTKVFVLKAIDLAGNVNEVKQTVIITDIFAPQISSYLIIKKDDKIQLNFKIIDENLMKYELVQNNLTLMEYISGQNIEKTINLPYTSGNVLFTVYDQNSNANNLNLNLDKSISYKQSSKYSNQKIFEITSSAKECFLTKFGTKDLSSAFDKSSSTFTIPVNANDIKNYNVEFYCTENNLKQYFKTDFYYDTIAPSEIELNLTNTADGTIELDWSGGIDTESDVIYNIFRDSKRIYSGKKSYYEDKDVEYPNSYTYYVEAVDEAKNSIKSKSLSEIPKKVKVKLSINLNKEQVFTNPEFTLKLTTDSNTDLSLITKHNGQVLFEKNIDNFSDTTLTQEVLFQEGINEVQISIKDEFSNILKETYYVTYSIPKISESVIDEQIISQKNDSGYKVTLGENITDKLVPASAQTLAENIVSNISSVLMTTNQDNPDEPKSFSYVKVILILLFIIFAVLTWQYTFHEEKLKQRLKDLRYVKDSKSINFFRKKDSSLNSSLEKIKIEREQKQHLKMFEAEKRKNYVEKERSGYEIQKFKDLKKRDSIADRMIINQRREVKEELKPESKSVTKPVEIPEKEFIDETELMQIHEKKLSQKKTSSFFDWFRKEEQKDDPLLKYITRQKSKNSWDSKTDFIAKEEPITLEKKPEVKDDLSLDKDRLSPEQIAKINQSKQVSDERNKEIFSENKTIQEKPVDKKHMLDDYLNKIIPKRKAYFTEREVNKDIFQRNK